jgi:rhodanese-related sulfurtransferase
MIKSIKISVIALIFLIFIILYAVYQSSHHMTLPSLHISTEEARAKRFDLILDMRSIKEREQLGYYPNSIPVSLDSLSTEVPSLLSNPSAPILVYSNGDNRANVAALMLYRMGYHNVQYLSTTYLSLMPGSQ